MANGATRKADEGMSWASAGDTSVKGPGDKMFKRVGNLSVFVVALAFSASPARAQGPTPTRDDVDEMIRKAVKQLRDEYDSKLRTRDEDLKKVADAVLKTNMDLGAIIRTLNDQQTTVGQLRRDLDDRHSAMLKIVSENQTALDHLTKDLDARHAALQKLLFDNQTGLDQITKTNSDGKRVLSAESIRNSHEVRDEIRRLIPPPVPLVGRLIVNNNMNEPQSLYVNGTAHLIEARSRRVIELPVGTFTYHLPHESSKYRTIGAPTYEAGVDINYQIQPQRYFRQVWDPILGWIWVPV